ncbi:delta-like protein A isoform X2 [Pomacea canaliculata]|uniref:delta-like protein A isoform X2 n=1 Tax=Pomacea canaliculata TaxID=400727 RepID=UPI000D728900|nr:delta-like protein A isoform X2 [Pomacea canaliculata]
MDRKVHSASTATLATLLVIVFGLACFQVVEGKGVVQVKAMSYSSSCSDNGFLRTQCDTFFQFCLKKPQSPSDSLNRCDYGSYGPTSEYEDQNNIDFSQAVTFAGGIANPMEFQVERFEGSELKLVIRVMDDEFWNPDEHLAWLTKVLSHTPAVSQQASQWSSIFTVSSGSYSFRFKFRSFCATNFYSPSCDVYCVAQDNDSGHYTCNQATGAKVCMAGWTGQRCSTDMDECAQGICRNGATCTNVPGSYSCACTQYFSGKNCEQVSSLCYSGPCQHGGSCSGIPCLSLAPARQAGPETGARQWWIFASRPPVSMVARATPTSVATPVTVLKAGPEIDVKWK